MARLREAIGRSAVELSRASPVHLHDDRRGSHMDQLFACSVVQFISELIYRKPRAMECACVLKDDVSGSVKEFLIIAPVEAILVNADGI